MSISIFERATKKKLRFETVIGNLTVEDVWDLPLTVSSSKKVSLDGLARSLYRKIKENEEESFVAKKTQEESDLNLRFDIVKHIIDVRMKEAENREKRMRDKEREQRILEILAKKEDEELLGKSKEELEALLKRPA